MFFITCTKYTFVISSIIHMYFVKDVMQTFGGFKRLKGIRSWFNSIYGHTKKLKVECYFRFFKNLRSFNIVQLTTYYEIYINGIQRLIFP